MASLYFVGFATWSSRIGQLGRLLPGASKKVPAQRLRLLEADGIVVRPPRLLDRATGGGWLTHSISASKD